MIKWSSLDGVCTDFSHALKLEIEKMGTLKNKWGPNGDPKSEKGPHGDPGPQMGTHVGAVPPRVFQKNTFSRKSKVQPIKH